MTTTQLDDAPTAPLEQYVERAYLDYAMMVVLERALPRLGDGLKPVQRRILFAMAELGLRRGGFKKSARTVGDVIGKYHPHGDAACYEAMVLMAQAFASRYPLVEGQGNWGSVDDPSSFAAMRYTEARLTPYAENLLEELHQGTTDWVQNFDGSMNEPLVLPARLPHLLLNGASGIAIGMATDIPSHNMGELGEACRVLLRRKTAGLDEILQAMPAPDFAGGGVVVSTPEEIRAAYQSGRGSLRVRAAWEMEEGQIVIRQLPPQVPGNRVLKQIAQEINEKRLTGILDLRDEGDEEQPVRLVLELKGGPTSAKQCHAPPVPDHRPGARGAGQPELHPAQRQAQGVRHRRDAARLAGAPRRSGAPAAGAPPGGGAGPAAPAGGAAADAAQPGPGGGHHPRGQGARPRADAPAEAQRGAGRGHPEPAAAPAEPAGGGQAAQGTAAAGRRAGQAGAGPVLGQAHQFADLQRDQGLQRQIWRCAPYQPGPGGGRGRPRPGRGEGAQGADGPAALA